MRTPYKVEIVPDIDFDLEVELGQGRVRAGKTLRVRVPDLEAGIGVGWLTGFLVYTAGPEKVDGITIVSARMGGKLLPMNPNPTATNTLSVGPLVVSSEDWETNTITLSRPFGPSTLIPALLFKLTEAHFDVVWKDIEIVLSSGVKKARDITVVAVLDAVTRSGWRRVEEIGLRQHYKLPQYGISIYRDLEAAGLLEPAGQSARPLGYEDENPADELPPVFAPDFIETLRIVLDAPTTFDPDEHRFVTVEVHVDGEPTALITVSDLVEGYRFLHPILVWDRTQVSLEWPDGWESCTFTVELNGSRMKAPRRENPSPEALAAAWNPIRRHLLIQNKELPRAYATETR